MGKSQRGQLCKKHGIPKTVNVESRLMCHYCRADKDEHQRRAEVRKKAKRLAELEKWHLDQQHLDDALNRCNAQRVVKTDRGAYYSSDCTRHEECRKSAAAKRV